MGDISFNKVKIEFVRDKKPMTAEVEVAEEESGAVFGFEGLQRFLESWRGYTDVSGMSCRTGAPTISVRTWAG